MSRPTEILIDQKALISNCQLARSLSPQSKLVAVVKADAYGHGANAITQALEPYVDMFAVSCMEEGLVVREAGITVPVLLLEGCFSADEFSLVCELNFDIVVHNIHQIDMLEKAELKKPVNAWLKIDTGMHRLGVSIGEAENCYLRLRETSGVGDIILTTHLASADCTESDFTANQLRCFHQAIASWGENCATSIANSAALLNWPQSRSHWNRPGIMLYGLSPFEENISVARNLQPVMSFKSQVIAVREIEKGESVGYGNTWTAERRSIIATVAAGYGDGYPRTAKSGTPVLVKQKRASLVGRVSMDMISVDVTDIDHVNVGDDVELWGQNLHANEVASWSGTIGYELVTRMPKRTKRRIINVE